MVPWVATGRVTLTRADTVIYPAGGFHARPWFVLRAPGSSCRPLAHLAGPWSVLRALIRPEGANACTTVPSSILQGPDSSPETRNKSILTTFFRWVHVKSGTPEGGLIRLCFSHVLWMICLEWSKPKCSCLPTDDMELYRWEDRQTWMPLKLSWTDCESGQMCGNWSQIQANVKFWPWPWAAVKHLQKHQNPSF